MIRLASFQDLIYNSLKDSNRETQQIQLGIKSIKDIYDFVEP